MLIIELEIELGMVYENSVTNIKTITYLMTPFTQIHNALEVQIILALELALIIIQQQRVLLVIHLIFQIIKKQQMRLLIISSIQKNPIKSVKLI